VNKFSKKINLILSEKDSGIYDAFNKGLKLSRGKIVGFLNAGDIYYPNIFLDCCGKSANLWANPSPRPVLG
jgi:glycosyltransferase involved in cell wall biosynthesis